MIANTLTILALTFLSIAIEALMAVDSFLYSTNASIGFCLT